MIVGRAAKMREAVAMRENGVRVVEIAAHLGVSPWTAGLWSSEYAQAKLREKRLGRVVQDRVCEFPMCQNVIPASAHARRRFCCTRCQDRSKHVVKSVA